MGIKLGRRYKDRVTGFEGVATSKTEFIYGCTRIGLEAMAGGEVKSHIFDEPSLDEVKEAEAVRVPRGRRTGGDRPTPSRMDRSG